MKLLGYTDRISAQPGDRVAFKVSGEPDMAYEVEIVRVICADPDPRGPGEAYQEIVKPFAAPLMARRQPVVPGSHATVKKSLPLRSLESFSLVVWVFPTTPIKGRQRLLGQWDDETRTGYSLEIGPCAGACFRIGASLDALEIEVVTPLERRRWTLVGAHYDAGTGECLVWQRPLHPTSRHAETYEASGSIAGKADLVSPFVLAGGGFNGKLERPRLVRGVCSIEQLATFAASHAAPAEAIAAWDFSIGMSGNILVDIGPYRLDAVATNTPARAVTGVDWNGDVLDPRLAPYHYAAVHFHSDDITDCGWQTDFEIDIGKDWPSGYYAARLIAADAVCFVPFFVRPLSAKPRARLAVIASTATYLAYANSHVKFDSMNSENLFESLLTVSETELFLHKHRELGYSTYDTHEDDSGVFYTSWLRPILTMQPGQYTFNYVNDTHLLAWLDHERIPYDVITDHDLHQEGLSLLQSHDVVITPSHPEYTSKQMWDALNAYQQGGGHHLYLGGNGFYWRIAFDHACPEVMETRRGGTGVRTWEGEPGEDCLSFTGEPGGLWRSHGRAPQRLVGVGFSATLFGRSTFYRRTKASLDPQYLWVFDGIGEDERIGDFGCRGGGAAGLEIDRFDADLGTPPGTVVLASSEPAGITGLLSMEEFLTTTRGLDGEQHGKVRADITLFETKGGGIVFSVGSIAWVTSLCHNDYDNNVARMTANVLRTVLDK